MILILKKMIMLSSSFFTLFTVPSLFKKDFGNFFHEGQVWTWTEPEPDPLDRVHWGSGSGPAKYARTLDGLEETDDNGGESDDEGDDEDTGFNDL